MAGVAAAQNMRKEMQLRRGYVSLQEPNLRFRVTSNMMTGSGQQHRSRHRGLERTAAMCLADRRTAQRMDDIWQNGDALLPYDTGGQDDATRTTNVDDDLDNNHHPLTLTKKSDGGPNDSPASLLHLKRSSILAPTPREPLLRLNIGGQSVILLTETAIQTEPASSFLSRFAQLPHTKRTEVADGFLAKSGEYYFQRSALAFDPVFQFYATGVMHKPPEMCPEAFLAELRFWGIPPLGNIASCCAEEIPKEKPPEKEDSTDLFEGKCMSTIRRRMWNFLESPGSCLASKVLEITSAVFVLASVMGLSIATIPELRVVKYVATSRPNASVRLDDGTVLEGHEPEWREHPGFEYLEFVCIAFFTVEYVLRFFAAPRKLRFALKPLNIVDVLAIVPFYIELALSMVGFDEKKLRDLRWAFLVVRILRVLRVIRIIKLGRFSSGLQTFAMTLQRSQKQLQMMAIVLLTGVVFFSTMIYFLEKDEVGTPFTSIPAAYWWCIVTMTTVGYGDAVPTTVVGKVVASAAIMCGVLVLALPITIIVDNFIKVAQDEAEQENTKADAEAGLEAAAIAAKASMV